MTSVELETPEVLNSEMVQALVGRLTRPDGRPISRGTLRRLIESGLPVHRMANSPRGRYHFYGDEVRAFVGNRWNRRTPAHRNRQHPDSDQ